MSVTDLDRAIVHARHALEVFERQSVRNDTLIATSCVDIGMIETHCRRFPAAIPPLERALVLRERLFGRESMMLNSILTYIGTALAMQGDLESAREQLERLERIVGRSGTPDDLSRWGTVNFLQHVHYMEDDLPRALEYARMDVDWQWTTGDTLAAIAAVNNLGTIYLQIGDAHGAREILAPMPALADRHASQRPDIRFGTRRTLAEACTRLLDMEAAARLNREAETAYLRERHRTAPCSPVRSTAWRTCCTTRSGTARSFLCAACREMLSERRRARRTTHPFYWAGFAASGW